MAKVKENKYPFTKEELENQICELWKDVDKIDYQAVADIFKRNGWLWGGLNEPRYTPEYRDIKRAIQKLIHDCKVYFVDMYFKHGVELDYDMNYTSINGGRLQCTLFWDADSDNNHFLSYRVELCFDIATIDKDGCISHIDEDD